MDDCGREGRMASWGSKEIRGMVRKGNLGINGVRVVKYLGRGMPSTE